MNTYKLSLSLLLMFLLGACSTSETSTNDQLTENYHLEIVDSVQVEILAQSPSLVDVHDESGDLLLIQSQPPKLWITSPEGEIKKVWEKSGSGPDEIGSILLSAEFFEDGVALMGYMQLKIFDQDLKLLKSFKPHYSLQGMVYTGFNHLFEFESQGSSQLVAYFGGPQTEVPYDSPEYYEEFNTVDVLNPYPQRKLNQEINDSLQFLPIGPLEEDNLFKKSERAFFYIKSVFDVAGDQLVYGYNWDTTLYKRTLPSGELISKEGIPFDQFYLNRGFSMGKAGEEMRSGNLSPRDKPGDVERVFNVGGKDLIVYRSGLSAQKVQELRASAEDFFQASLKTDFTKYLILKDGHRLNNELRYPIKAYAPTSKDKSGFLYANQNLSALYEEPEVLTIYKLKIVSDDE